MAVTWMRTSAEERRKAAARVDDKLMDALADEMVAKGRITPAEKALRDAVRQSPPDRLTGLRR
jgi:hypothetical protein